MPASYSSGDATVTLSTKLTWSGDVDSDDVADAISRYQDLMFPHAVSDSSAAAAEEDTVVVSEVVVSILEDDAAELQLYADESYTLVVPATDGGKIELSAPTQWGIMRGLETLSQLVLFDFDANAYTVDNSPWNIEDAPRFPHRQVRYLFLDYSANLPDPTRLLIPQL